MNRRGLLRSGLGASLALLTNRKALGAPGAAVQITPDESGAVINPHIYGHFIEHLGGVIYDGVWVGPDSKIANIGGIRKRFVDDMKRIAAPNLRWPGGCFADGYHWRDGIGARARRPRTYNYWEGQMPPGVHATETNEFGVHEFMRLCRLTGAEPYLAANIGSGSPREFYEWAGYSNAPAGTLSLASERAANGDAAPFNVRYWGVGNESWGCGGRMTPQEYAAAYRLYTAQPPAYLPMFLIAVGPRGHSPDTDIAWTTGFFEGLRDTRAEPPDGFAMHYYTDFRPTPVKAETSTTREWYAVLHQGARIEQVLEKHWAAMAPFDPRRRTRFVIDEWGTWYTQASRRIAPHYILSQTITLRDAVHAAMTFDIFNRHTDRIAMANIAQTINCLDSLFLAQEDKFVRTPVFHVFEMYRPHRNGRLARMEIDAEPLKVPLLAASGSLAGIAGSASITNRNVHVTLTNPSVESATSVRLRLSGSLQVIEGRATVLHHEDPAAANTFTAPEQVVPAPLAVEVSSGAAAVRLPKQSVAAIDLRIA